MSNIPQTETQELAFHPDGQITFLHYLICKATEGKLPADHPVSEESIMDAAQEKIRYFYEMMLLE